MLAFLSTVIFRCACSSALSSSTPPSSTDAKLRLKYFNARGAVETARVLLAIGDEKYEDVRYDITPGTMDAPAFKIAKEEGELVANLGRAPVLVTEDGAVVGQSRSIERFLARRFGLMGTTPTEEALVDCVAEHCRDVKDAAMRKGFSAFARGKTDEEKAAARAEWFETDLPTMLGKMDAAVRATSAKKGCAVGSATSYADVVVWALLRDCSPADAEATTEAAADCEALNAIADSIASNPKVAKWLEDRPSTMF